MRESIATTAPALAMIALMVPAAFLLTAAAVSAQEGVCDTSRVIIEGGDPSPFILPDDEDKTLTVDPWAVLLIRGENPPPSSTLRLSLSGIGVSLDREFKDFGTTPVTIDLADYSGRVRGLFQLKGTLLSNGTEICTTLFRAKISGFGGTVATVATAAAAVTGVGALAGAAYAASGSNARLNLKVRIERRRRTGWRRWIPVPAWKRIITSTITGAVTGLAGTVLLQQGGIMPLSLTSAVWGLIVGGGTTFGMGLSFGVLLTFIRPPVEEPA